MKTTSKNGRLQKSCANQQDQTRVSAPVPLPVVRVKASVVEKVARVTRSVILEPRSAVEKFVEKNMEVPYRTGGLDNSL
jgi:hypothetical protein